MKHDYSIFEKVPLQEILNNEETYSDTDTEKSEQEENYLSDEELKNNYTFLESFKKSRKKKKEIKKKGKNPPPEPVKEDIDESENESESR